MRAAKPFAASLRLAGALALAVLLSGCVVVPYYPYHPHYAYYGGWR